MKLKIHEVMELPRLHRRHKRYAKARSLYETNVKAQPDNAKALHQPALVARDAGSPRSPSITCCEPSMRTKIFSTPTAI